MLAYERLPVTAAEREQFVAFLRREAELVESTPELAVIEADPDDNAFLEVAVAGGAAYLVSGDEHLLDLEHFRDIEIIPPAVFIEVV